MMPRHRKRGVRGHGSVFTRKDGRWVAPFIVEETGETKATLCNKGGQNIQKDRYSLAQAETRDPGNRAQPEDRRLSHLAAGESS